MFNTRARIRQPRFVLYKALLAGTLLLSLAALPAQAQTATDPSLWTATNPSGSPLPQIGAGDPAYNNNDGSYNMYGTQSGQFSSGYPTDLINAGYLGFGPLPSDTLTQPNNLDTGWDHTIIGAFCWADNYGLNSHYWDAKCYYAHGHYQPIIGSSSATVSGSFYARFNYTPTASSPPPPPFLNLLVTTTLQAYASGYYAWSGQTSGLSGQASASLGAPFTGQVQAQASSVSSGFNLAQDYKSQVVRRLVRVPVSSGSAEVSVPGITMSMNASNGIPWGQELVDPDDGPYYQQTNGSASAGGEAYVTALARIDNREVTLRRDGAHNETVDPDGTVHGDTIYSYMDTIPVEGGVSVADVKNWQYFHPQFSGGWRWTVDYNNPFGPSMPDVDWVWNPDESDDTWDTGQWKMPYGSVNMEDGDWVGTPTGASTRTMTYTATDNGDGAQATATYYLTRHDPVEWNTSASITDLPPTLIGSCDHPVSAGADVIVTFPPPSGTMDYSDGVKIFSIVTAGVSSIPVEGDVPALAMVLLSSISATAGSYAPNTPYDQKTVSSSAGDFATDVSTQVNINNGNTSGILFLTPTRITGANISDVSANPSEWYAGTVSGHPGYWTVTGQATEYREKAQWLGQTYDAGGYTGPTHSTADFRTRIGDVVRTWTFNPLQP